METQNNLIRIRNQLDTYYYVTRSTDVALDMFAQDSGYEDFTNYAAFDGHTVEQAKKDIGLDHVSLREALDDIIDEALESNAAEDGATGRFPSSEEWAAWSLLGATGEQARAFAREHGLSVVEVMRTIETALRARNLKDINLPFEQRKSRDVIKRRKKYTSPEEAEQAFLESGLVGEVNDSGNVDYFSDDGAVEFEIPPNVTNTVFVCLMRAYMAGIQQGKRLKIKEINASLSL